LGLPRKNDLFIATAQTDRVCFERRGGGRRGSLHQGGKREKGLDCKKEGRQKKYPNHLWKRDEGKRSEQPELERGDGKTKINQTRKKGNLPILNREEKKKKQNIYID